MPLRVRSASTASRTRPGRCVTRLGAQRGGQLAVAQRRAAPVGVQRELHLEHDRGIRVLENAGPVTEADLVRPTHRSSPVRRSSSRTRLIVSATSGPYAPTFCTGVAPAEPGMPDRHSSPPRPCASAVTTTSSHTAPASARTMLPSTVISVLASSTTVRSARSSASTTLDPPASTSTVRGSASSAQQHATICSVVSQVISRRATGPTRSVVSGASGTASATTAPPISELTTGGNGSLASYAAFIRHGHRIRGQRRTGSPGIQRRTVLAGAAGRFRRRRCDAGSR